MPAPLRSMTGYARVRRPLGEGELTVSIKSVNHRGLDLQIQCPSILDPTEAGIRAAVKAMPADRTCKCGSALAHALVTNPKMVPAATKRKLAAIVGRYLK